MSSKKERVFKWDNLKFLLILLVVIGHFIEPYTGQSLFFKGLFTFIYSFHMPLFIFIAGFFHKNEKIIEKIYFFVLIRLLLGILIFNELFVLGKNPKFSIFNMPDITWFMFAMAVFIGFAYLLRNINCKFVLVMSILVACIVGYDRSINDFLASSRILVYFPYYIAGIWARKNENLLSFDSDVKNKWIYWLVVIAWFLVCVLFINYTIKLTPFFTGRHPYSDKVYYWGPIIRLVSYIIVATVSYAIIRITPINHILKISDMGAKTLQIYFWHKIFLNLLLLFDFINISPPIIGKIFYIAMAVIMTVILSHDSFGFPISNLKAICLKERV